MKKFVFALSLFCVLLACGIWYQYGISGFARSLGDYCIELEQLAYGEDFAALEKQYDALCSYWEEKGARMSYLIDHEYLNSLSGSIGELGMAIHAQDTSEMLMIMARVQKEAQAIAKDELFLPENIF